MYYRSEMIGPWRGWMWKLWTLAMLPMTTSTTPLWCQHATTELRKLYWVICLHYYFSVVYPLKHVHDFEHCKISAGRTGLESGMWRVEFGLYPDWVLSGINVISGANSHTDFIILLNALWLDFKCKILTKTPSFQTHDSKEHLAMMERVLGPIPAHLLQKTRCSIITWD